MRFRQIFLLAFVSTLSILVACSEAVIDDTATTLTKTVEYTLPEGTTEVETLTLAKWDAVADGKHRGAKITFIDLPKAAQDYLLTNADTSTVKKYLKLTAKDSTTFYLVKFSDRGTQPLAFDAAGALITRPVGGGHHGTPRDSGHVHHPRPPHDSTDSDDDSTHVHHPRPPHDSTDSDDDSTHVHHPRPPHDSTHVHHPRPPRDSSGVGHGPRGGRGGHGNDNDNDDDDDND